MGLLKRKIIILMSIADLAPGCTATGTTVCTTAGSCCAAFTKVTAVADVPANGVMICIPVGSKIATALTIPVVAPVTSSMLTGAPGYPLADCAAATTGPSALAVSAVAAATAVYMM